MLSKNKKKKQKLNQKEQNFQRSFVLKLSTGNCSIKAQIYIMNLMKYLKYHIYIYLEVK